MIEMPRFRTIVSSLVSELTGRPGSDPGRRNFQMARWIGGETHLWVGRRKTVCHGEASSGLRYDVAE
jgi:hypothetical protein